MTDPKSAPRKDEDNQSRRDPDSVTRIGESQASPDSKPKDSKHYQVGGDKRFPRKYSKTGHTQLRAAGQDSSRRVLQAANYNSRAVELYLPNISRHPNDALSDIAEMVRECGRQGKVHVITSRVVFNLQKHDNVNHIDTNIHL